MIRLDAALLESVGLGSLPPEDANSLLKHLYETLEMRVGYTLAERFSPEQLDEFEAIIDTGDEAAARAFLADAAPDHRDVVRAAYDAMVEELRQQAPALLAAIREG